MPNTTINPVRLREHIYDAVREIFTRYRQAASQCETVAQADVILGDFMNIGLSEALDDAFRHADAGTDTQRPATEQALLTALTRVQTLRMASELAQATLRDLNELLGSVLEASGHDLSQAELQDLLKRYKAVAPAIQDINHLLNEQGDPHENQTF